MTVGFEGWGGVTMRATVCNTVLATCLVMLVFVRFFFWPCQAACGILVPQPGIEPVPPALGAQSLSHRTVRDVLMMLSLGLCLEKKNPVQKAVCTRIFPAAQFGRGD